MKNLFLAVCFFSCLMSVKAQHTRQTSTCVQFNFLGIVSIWSGSMNTETFDPITEDWVVTASRPCGKGDGSWDWFWE